VESRKNEILMTDIVPFAKYRGQPVENWVQEMRRAVQGAQLPAGAADKQTSASAQGTLSMRIRPMVRVNQAENIAGFTLTHNQYGWCTVQWHRGAT
jgi:hypothetical protein